MYHFFADWSEFVFFHHRSCCFIGNKKIRRRLGSDTKAQGIWKPCDGLVLTHVQNVLLRETLSLLDQVAAADLSEEEKLLVSDHAMSVFNHKNFVSKR